MSTTEATMSTTEAITPKTPGPAKAAMTPSLQGIRKNGKQWHAPKKAFRPTSGLTPYAKRAQLRTAQTAMKAKERELKDEKEAERQRRIQSIRKSREAKAEKERYAKMAEKMHKKRVERLKRKEKRNKLLNS